MIARQVKIQLVVFVLISIVGVIYTGLNYVGVHLVGGPYTVKAIFTDSGGIFKNAEVTERGVVVGRVADLTLNRNFPNGVEVDLHIDSRYKIPQNTRAVVANLSAVGEQYVDLEPQTDSGPYLANGSLIPMTKTQIPISDVVLLQNLNKLVTSVNTNQLQTVIAELGKAFNGTGPDLARLISEGDALVQAAQQNLPSNVTLLNDGKTVLDTQRAVSQDLQVFAANLAQFSGQLVTSDPSLRGVFDNGVGAAQQLQTLLADNRTALPVLLGNLITLGQIQAARLPGLQEILALYPANVANGFLASAGGYAHFAAATTSNPPVCQNGYLPPDPNKQGKNPPSAYGGPADLNTYCQEPPNGGPQGIDVRGARNAPRPPGDITAGPPPGGYQQRPGTSYPTGSSAAPGSSSSAAAAGGGPVAAAPYNPLSGIVQAPNGRLYQLGGTGGQAQAFGSQSWQWLLLAPALG